MDNEKTGKLIRTLRIEKGITQKELAEKIQVSNATVSKWSFNFVSAFLWAACMDSGNCQYLDSNSNYGSADTKPRIRHSSESRMGL